ncbi:MAG TPA: SWIM zinc finger family protein [Actinomycetota bacterium]|nr:SWIM zinc finger family protein [Actinomycetota bacterium]
MSGWYPPPSRPRPVEGGLKARSRRGAIGETWWSRRFIDLLESFRLGGRLDRGRRYARAGQVLDLQVAAGLVSARVQGSRVRPYRVRLETPVLAAPDWERVEQAMAGRAAFAARLLAGEMPHDIEEAFAAAGVSLFPASPRNLASSCSCPDWSNPCKHVAAVYYLLAEAFDDDPFLIFAWRGRTRGQLLGRLRTLRDGDTSPAEAPRTSEAGGPDQDDGGGLVPPVAAPPLADCLDRFWSAGDLGALRVRPRAAEVPDALLRQLDPPAVDVAGRDLAELLAPAYRILTVAAERRALAEDTG